MIGKWTRGIFGDKRDPRVALAEEFETTAPEAGVPPREAMSWGHDVLAGAGIDAAESPEAAIGALRSADGRQLSLTSAKFLADHLVRS